MRVLFITLLMSVSLWANQKVVQLFGEDEFKAGFVTAFLDDGEIVHIKNSNQALIEKIELAFKQSQPIALEKKNTGEDKASLVEDIQIVLEIPTFLNRDKEMYDPNRFSRIQWMTQDPLEYSGITELSSYESAQNLMNKFNGNTDDKSQCYNRAHMWTYESLARERVNLGKVWIFFTRKYIREFNYKWWFHVSPYTEVAPNRFKYVLDRGFTMIPYTMDNWKNMFIKNHAECPVVTEYTAYENFQNNQYCYLIYSSQYYWQPWQLEKLTKEGIHRYGYKENELKITYRDALSRWNGRMPRMVTSPNNPLPGSGTTTPPTRPTRPGNGGSTQPDPNSNAHNRTLAIGEYIYDLNLKARGIVLNRSNDVYTVKYTSGSQNGRELRAARASLAVLSGCFLDVCVGNNVYSVAYNGQAILSRVHGISLRGEYILEYRDYQNRHTLSLDWQRANLAIPSGCVNGFCVGHVMRNRHYDNVRVEVIAIQQNGKFIIKFLEGSYRGSLSPNWTASHFR